MGLSGVRAEVVLVAYLRAALADTTRVAQKVPTTRPQRLVQVVRTGGAPLHRVVDRAQLTVTAWAESEVEAEKLASRCRDAVLAATRAGAAQVFMPRSEVLGYYYDPDPESGADRYTFTAIVSMRAPRAA